MLFEEVQPFRQNPVVWLLAPAALFFLAGVGSVAWGAPVSPGLWVGVVAIGGVSWLLLAGKLHTQVRDDALHTRLFPLTREHRFAWHEIESCEAVQYRPIRDYGGWGVRFSRHGKAYNVSGSRGVQLRFTNGKRLLIGSQRADELAAVINSRLGR